MRRVFLTYFMTAIVFAAVIALVGAALFRSEPGREFLAGRIETSLSNALGGDVKIGALSGALPQEIILTDVIFSDDDAVWARIDRLDLIWKPLRLLFGEIVIDRTAIAGGDLNHAPPDMRDLENGPFSINLPEDTPRIRLNSLLLSDVRSALTAERAVLNGDGAIFLEGPRVDAYLRLESSIGADRIKTDINIDPNANRFLVDIEFISNENGALAALSNLGGPVELKATSRDDEPGLVDLTSSLGEFGELSALFGFLKSERFTMTAEGNFKPGPALAENPLFDREIPFDIELRDRANGGILSLTQVGDPKSAIITGDLIWRGGFARNVTVETDLRARFGPDAPPEAQRYFGEVAHLVAELVRKRDAYDLTARLESDNLTADLTEARTDLRSSVSGTLVANLEKNAPVTNESARLAVEFKTEKEGTITAPSLVLTLPDALGFSGNAGYQPATGTITLGGDTDIKPGFATSLSPNLRPSDSIIVAFTLEGPPDLFTLEASIDAPDIAIGDDIAPAFQARLGFAGLPRRPTGDLEAQAVKSDGALSLSLRSSVDGAVSAPKILYTGKNFRLNGTGTYAPSREAGEINLTYRGADNAKPLPGLNIAGMFDINGAFSRRDSLTMIQASAELLRINGADIADLKLEAAGPPGAVNMTVNAGRISPRPNFDIGDISANARLDARNGIRITLQDFTGFYAENDFRLLNESKFSTTNGVAIDGFRLGWGDKGSIALDANFNDARWRGEIDIVDFNIPGADTQLTLAASLDTNKIERATGDFSLASLLSEEAAPIRGSFIWRNQTVRIQSAPEDSLLSLELQLPAKLRRAPKLALRMSGEIKGAIEYNGSIDPFTAFLPPDFQTLEGALNINVGLSGTTKKPALTGGATLTDGAYTELRSGLSFADLNANARASFDGRMSNIEFSGGARGGAQTGEDTIKIGGEAVIGETSKLDLDILFDNAVLAAHPIRKVRADGAVKIEGPFDVLQTTGALDIRELDAQIITPPSTGLTPIQVVNIDDPSIRLELERQQRGGNIDVTINANDRIFIRGRGVDSEWAAAVRALGDSENVTLLGNMSLRRGTLDFAGRRFDITRGDIAFDRLSPNNPALDIRAEYQTNDGILASINIAGRAREPQITLESTPSRPQTDIMALVLFGKPADELSAFESFQTAEALASLGGIGPFGGGGVTGALRQATGLDMVNFNMDPETGGGSLTVGKYVADGLFVSATQDGTGDGGAVVVEYEINDNFTVETELRQDGDQTVSANWKKDF